MGVSGSLIWNPPHTFGVIRRAYSFSAASDATVNFREGSEVSNRELNEPSMDSERHREVDPPPEYTRIRRGRVSSKATMGHSNRGPIRAGTFLTENVPSDGKNHLSESESDLLGRQKHLPSQGK